MGTDSVERSIGRIEGKLDSVIGIIGTLSASFDQMANGRLSKLEIAFATMRTEVETKAKFSALIWSLASSLVVSALSGIFVVVYLHYH